MTAAHATHIYITVACTTDIHSAVTNTTIAYIYMLNVYILITTHA